ncbi:MAG: hypothetical protein AVDCRST_MAG73-3170, partial [uncultured Thermomicrobiales bacterium]
QSRRLGRTFTGRVGPRLRRPNPRRRSGRPSHGPVRRHHPAGSRAPPDPPRPSRRRRPRLRRLRRRRHHRHRGADRRHDRAGRRRPALRGRDPRRRHRQPRRLRCLQPAADDRDPAARRAGRVAGGEFV